MVFHEVLLLTVIQLHTDVRAAVFLYLLGSLVEHLAGAGELVGVGGLPPQRGGVGRPGGRLLSGWRFGDLVG